MKYKILMETGVQSLEKEVLAHISDGWTPTGGVAVAAPVIDEAPAPIFLQAMINTN